MPKKVINAFNVGEVSPYVHARTDNQLYNAACLKMENFIPLEYGGATRRPSSEYFASESNECFLYKFVFNKENTYLLAFSEKTLSIYKENEEIEEAEGIDEDVKHLVASLTTPFRKDSLPKLKFVQANNVLFISSEDYPVQTLSRLDNNNFEINELEFKYPPITETLDDVSIFASNISGNATLTSNKSIFTQGMVGQTIILKQYRDLVNSMLSEELGYQADIQQRTYSSAINVSFSNYTIETNGEKWRGKIVVEKSTDGGASFNPEFVLTDTSAGRMGDKDTLAPSNNVASFSTSKPEGANTFIRVHYQSKDAGENDADKLTVFIKIKVDSIYLKGVFKITSVPSSDDLGNPIDSSTKAEGVFISPIQDTQTSYTSNQWQSSVNYKRGTKLRFTGSFEYDADFGGSGTQSLELTDGSMPHAIDMTYDYVNSAFYFLTHDDKIVKYDYNKVTHALTYRGTRSLTYGDQYTGAYTGRGTQTGQAHFGIAFHNDDTYDQKLFLVMRKSRSGGNNSGSTHVAKNAHIRIKYIDVWSGTSTADITSSTNFISLGTGGIFKHHRSAVNIHGLSYGDNKFYFKAYEYWKTNKYQQAVARYSVSLTKVVTRSQTSYQYGKERKWSSNGKFRTYDWKMFEETSQSASAYTMASDVMTRDQIDSVYMDGYVVALNDMSKSLEFRTKTGSTTGRSLALDPKLYYGLAAVPKRLEVSVSKIVKGNKYIIKTTGSHSDSTKVMDNWSLITGVPYTELPEVDSTFIAFNDGITFSAEEHGTFHNVDVNGTFELHPDDLPKASSIELDVFVLSNSAKFGDQNIPNGTSSLDRISFSGNPDYYQCIENHTSTDSFSNDLEMGYWAKRHPYVTEVDFGAFSPDNGYPRSISLFENRLCLGGNKKNPNRLWISQTDDFNNFLTGSLDTDALDLKFNSLTQDEIEWLVPTTKLIIGTSENEWSLDSGSQTQALTPTQINLKKQSQYGSSQQQGILVNSAVLFLMRQGKKLREWYLQENQQDYLAKDLAFIAEHITGDGIKQMAVQVQPTTTVWMVRKDGVLVGLTYERETQTFAWHRHVFDGMINSVSVLPSLDNEDDVYLSSSNYSTSALRSNVGNAYIGLDEAIRVETGDSVSFDVIIHAVPKSGSDLHGNNYWILGNSSTNNAGFQIDEDGIPRVRNNGTVSNDIEADAVFDELVLKVDHPYHVEIERNNLLKYTCTLTDLKTGKVSSQTEYTTVEITHDIDRIFNGSSADSRGATLANIKIVDAHYKLDEGTGTTVTDANGSGNDGTLVGTNIGAGNNFFWTTITDCPKWNHIGDTIIKLDKQNWGTDHTQDYSGLDYYTKLNLENVKDSDLKLFTPLTGLRTSSETSGNWKITATNGGTVQIHADTLHRKFTINANGQNNESGAFVNEDILVQDNHYELVYEVEYTDTPNGMLLRGEPLQINGSDVTPNGYTNTEGTEWIELKHDVGTHVLRFKNHVTDDLHFNRAGSDTHQRIKLISLKDVTPNNLDHLNGKQATVIINGEKIAPSSNTLVTNGVMAQPLPATSSETKSVYIGLPYTSTLAPLYVDVQGTQGSKKAIQHAVIRFKDTLKAKVGQKEDALDPVKFGSSLSLNTEDAEAWLANHNEFLQTVYVVQDEPSPCTVLAMVIDVESV